MSRKLSRYVVLALALLACALPAVSGTIPLAWDAVPGTNVAGYRVYYGSKPGTYTKSLDVGNTTSATVTGLADCTTWYLSVKAYNTAGTESAAYSNEVTGWARPVVASVAPASAKQGSRVTLTLTGNDLRSGATVQFGNPSISVNSASVASCGGLTADVTIAAGATVGSTNVDVMNTDGTFGTLAGAFTVLSGAKPVISAVSATAVASTTATITWTTDVASRSFVVYRRSGETGYQQMPLDLNLVTAHSVALQGLTPATVYEYHVRSRDAGGNVSVSSPDQTFTTTSNAYRYIRFEAEAGNLVAPVVAASGYGPFGSGSVTTPMGTPTGSPGGPSGTATYGINVPSADIWYLWVRVYGAYTGSSGWLQSMDGGLREAFFAPVYSGWAWAGGPPYSLQAGLHTIELGGYDAGALADRILLTNDRSFVPTEQPVDDQFTPAAPTQFTATAGWGKVTLSWTNPADADFHDTVMRYRTDGNYPVSPEDGFAVTVRNNAPGTADSYVHRGLVSGTTYSYTAFARDASGNVSMAAHARAAPR
jgi:Purple acid Phosphatase, N-terminal domain/Quinohemoprotein amine dehydrogenase, alpha subunit domain III